MTTHKPFWIGLVTLSFVFSVTLSWFVGQALQPPVEQRMFKDAEKRVVRYSFTLRNETNLTVDDVRFTAFAPVKNTPFQTVQSIGATSPFQIQSDALGNQRLIFMIEPIAPFGERVVTVTTIVFMRKQPIQTTPLFSDKTPRQWRTPTLAKGHAAVLSALNAIGPERGAATLKPWGVRATGWVHGALKDVGYVSRDLGPEYALTERAGDCTEYMGAFVELARQSSVIAVSVAGFRTHGISQLVEASDYHNWAMARFGNKWAVSDPYMNEFASHQDEYVAFRLLGGGDNGSDAQRFFSHDDRISVVMR
ncbi:transglutaminase-like domain-containing protein [Marinobacter sp. C2H3]|uniref:transglutaminase-like domain-containing protein n=1 Tax=Marinobacter sp. C2H3 TaxID=3119003 RepID=UPI00300F3EF4